MGRDRPQQATPRSSALLADRLQTVLKVLREGWPKLLKHLRLLRSRTVKTAKKIGQLVQRYVPFANRSIWWGYAPVILVALLGVAITLRAFMEVTNWERERSEGIFREASRDRVLAIHREVKFTFEMIQDIASFFEVSSGIGRREFRRFVGPAIRRHPGIQSLLWVPLVKHPQREAFTRSARISFSPFEIVEQDAGGQISPAGERHEYLPVLYVQPYSNNKHLLGLDMATVPHVQPVIARSRETGTRSASDRILLRDAGVEKSAFAISIPVYKKSDNEEPEQPELQGFALGIFTIGEVVELALDSLSIGGIDIKIFETPAGKEDRLLYEHVSRLGRDRSELADQPETEKFHFSQSFVHGDHRWKVVCTPISGRYEPDPWGGWLVLIGGFAFTTLLTVYISTLVGHTEKVNLLVAKRTAQLSGAVKALNREIGERRNAETELQHLNETLEHLVEIRSSEAERRAGDLEQFAYVTSHDLKAPLRAIGNLAEWISEDLQEKLDHDTREQLSLLHDRVRRMHDLIEGLLEYSRVGRTAGSIEEVDTRQLLLELIDSLSPPEEVTIKIGKNMPRFPADRLLLGQVFSNLISNSLKHGKPDGRIKINAHDAGEYYAFTVKDNGPGIAPEYHEKVFMMFQTLEPKDYGSNTGIGLALVRKIVQEQGGVITLNSGTGEGASFRFTWPKGPELR